MFTWDVMVVFYSQFGFYKENNYFDVDSSKYGNVIEKIKTMRRKLNDAGYCVVTHSSHNSS